MTDDDVLKDFECNHCGDVIDSLTNEPAIECLRCGSYDWVEVTDDDGD